MPTQNSKQIILDLFPDNGIMEITAGDIRRFVNAIFDESINKADIVDDITTADSSRPLSANQGNELGQRLADVELGTAGFNADIVEVKKDISDLKLSDQDDKNNIKDIVLLLNKNIIDTTDNKNEIIKLDANVKSIAGTLTNFDTEIKQNESHISVLHSNVNSNKALIDDNKKDISQNTQEIVSVLLDIKNVKISLNKLNKNFANLGTSLSYLTSRVSKLEADDAQFTSEFAQVKVDQANNINAIAVLEKEMKDGQPLVAQNALDIKVLQGTDVKHDARLTDQDTRLQKVEKEIIPVSRIIQIESQIKNGFQAVSDNTKNINDILSKLISFGDSVMRLGADVVDNTSTIQKQGASITGTINTVNGIKTDVRNVRSDVNQLQGFHTQTARTLQLHEQSIQTNAAKNTSNKAEIDVNVAHLTNNDKKIQALETISTTNKNDIFNTKQDLKVSNNHIKQNLDAINDHTTDLYNQDVKLSKINTALTKLQPKVDSNKLDIDVLKPLVQTNSNKLQASSLKIAYESNPDTNAFTDKNSNVVNKFTVFTVPNAGEEMGSNLPVFRVGEGFKEAGLVLLGKDTEPKTLAFESPKGTEAFVGIYPQSSSHPGDVVVGSNKGGVLLDSTLASAKMRIRKGGVYSDIVSVPTPTKDGIVSYTAAGGYTVGDLSKLSNQVIIGTDADTDSGIKIRGTNTRIDGGISTGIDWSIYSDEVPSATNPHVDTVIDSNNGNFRFVMGDINHNKLLKTYELNNATGGKVTVSEEIVGVDATATISKTGQYSFPVQSYVPGFGSSQPTYGIVTLDLYESSEIDQKLDDKVDLNLVKTPPTATNEILTQADAYDQHKIDSFLIDKADKTDVYGKTDVDNMMNLKADQASHYTKSQIDNRFQTVYLKSETYDQTRIDAELAKKADISDIYTQNIIDNKMVLKLDKSIYDGTINTLALKTDVAKKANSADVYDKPGIDLLLADKADKNDMTLIANDLTALRTKYNTEHHGKVFIDQQHTPGMSTSTTATDVRDDLNTLIVLLQQSGLLKV